MLSVRLRLNLYHVGNALLLVYLPWFAWRVWDVLPERVPIHFDFHNEPDRWTNKGFELIALFVLFPWLMSLLLYGLTWLVRWMVARHPEWVNLPRKELFLKLPAVKQDAYFRVVTEMMISMALCCNLLFAGIAHATVGLATGQFDSLPSWMVWPWVGLLLFVILSYGLLLFRLPGRLIREHEAESGKRM